MVASGTVGHTGSARATTDARLQTPGFRIGVYVSVVQASASVSVSTKRGARGPTSTSAQVAIRSSVSISAIGRAWIGATDHIENSGFITVLDPNPAHLRYQETSDDVYGEQSSGVFRETSSTPFSEGASVGVSS